MNATVSSDCDQNLFPRRGPQKSLKEEYLGKVGVLDSFSKDLCALRVQWCTNLQRELMFRWVIAQDSSKIDEGIWGLLRRRRSKTLKLDPDIEVIWWLPCAGIGFSCKGWVHLPLMGKDCCKSVQSCSKRSPRTYWLYWEFFSAWRTMKDDRWTLERRIIVRHWKGVNGYIPPRGACKLHSLSWLTLKIATKMLCHLCQLLELVWNL